MNDRHPGIHERMASIPASLIDAVRVPQISGGLVDQVDLSQLARSLSPTTTECRRRALLLPFCLSTVLTGSRMAKNLGREGLFLSLLFAVSIAVVRQPPPPDPPKCLSLSRSVEAQRYLNIHRGYQAADISSAACVNTQLERNIRFRRVRVVGTGDTVRLDISQPSSRLDLSNPRLVTIFVVTAEKLLSRLQALGLRFFQVQITEFTVLTYGAESNSSLKELQHCFVEPEKELSWLPNSMPWYAYFNGMTHLAAVAEIVRQGLPYALIIEDDVHVSDDGIRMVNSMPQGGMQSVLASVLRNDSDVVVFGAEGLGWPVDIDDVRRERRCIELG